MLNNSIYLIKHTVKQYMYMIQIRYSMLIISNIWFIWYIINRLIPVYKEAVYKEYKEAF